MTKTTPAAGGGRGQLRPPLAPLAPIATHLPQLLHARHSVLHVLQHHRAVELVVVPRVPHRNRLRRRVRGRERLTPPHGERGRPYRSVHSRIAAQEDEEEALHDTLRGGEGEFWPAHAPATSTVRTMRTVSDTCPLSHISSGGRRNASAPAPPSARKQRGRSSASTCLRTAARCRKSRCRLGRSAARRVSQAGAAPPLPTHLLLRNALPGGQKLAERGRLENPGLAQQLAKPRP